MPLIPALTSIEDLKNYCFRKLGSPVINIEVDSSQAYDRINDAVQLFTQRHYDGNEESFILKTVLNADVENGYLTLDSSINSVIDVLGTSTTSVETLDNIDYQYMLQNINKLEKSTFAELYVAKQHIALYNFLFTVKKAFSYNGVSNKFDPHWTLTDIGSQNILKNADNIESWTLTGPATVMNNAAKTAYGKQEAHTITSTGAGTITISETVSSNDAYVRGYRSLNTHFRSDNFTGTVTTTIKDGAGTVVGTKVSSALSSIWTKSILESIFDATHTKDTTVEISFTSTGAGEIIELTRPYLYVNSSFMIHCNKNLLLENEEGIYNNEWVKKYCTALIKRQWGSNIKKFDGVQLPGGITMNGQSIFDEANEEVNKLEEEFSLAYELPLSIMMG